MNISFDVDFVYVNSKIKPTYKEDEVYPNMNRRKGDQSPIDFDKDFNKIAANSFRQGYSLRTYMGTDMFSYREDNV